MSNFQYGYQNWTKIEGRTSDVFVCTSFLRFRDISLKRVPILVNRQSMIPPQDSVPIDNTCKLVLPSSQNSLVHILPLRPVSLQEFTEFLFGDLQVLQKLSPGVEFMNPPLGWSIHKYQQNAKRWESQEFQRSFEIFLVAGIWNSWQRNMAFANARDKQSHQIHEFPTYQILVRKSGKRTGPNLVKGVFI